MKQKEVFVKIGGIIQELIEQYDYLKSVTEDFNDLELELFVANAHFLTDHIEILCKLNLQSTKAKRAMFEKPESSAHKFFEPVVQQMNRGKDYKELKALRELKFPKPVNRPVEIEVNDTDAASETSVADPDQISLPFATEVADPTPAETPENTSTPVETKETIVAGPRHQPLPVDEDKPVAQFNFSSDVPADGYDYIREEPEVIRHELVLDEATAGGDDEDTHTVKDALAEIERDKNEPVTEHAPIAYVAAAAAEETPEPVKEQAPLKEPKTAREAKPEPAAGNADEVLTINQKMSAQLGDRPATKGEAIKPISDIKLAITLNDKLLYVKDLFNGYNLAYSEAVEILNRFNSFEEAHRFLRANYVVKNNWDSKPATTEKFYALLKRRYAW